MALFNAIDIGAFEENVIQGKVLAGIPQENKSYTFVYPFGEKRLKFDVWRIGDNIFGEASVAADENSEFVHKYRLVWYAIDSDDCFRVIPDGCVHEENT